MSYYINGLDHCCQDYQPTAELACFLLTSDTVKRIQLLNKIMLGDIISLILFFFIVDTFT